MSSLQFFTIWNIMRALKKLCVLVPLLLAMGVGQPANAQTEIKKVGQSTMGFLNVSLVPRAAGMANTFTATSEGVGSLMYNPAGLAGVSAGTELLVTNTQWIADINYTTGMIGHSLGTVGTVGVSVLAVDYGDIQGAELLSQSDPEGYRETALLNPGAYAFGLGYARQISDRFSMGGQLQYVTQSLGETELRSGMTENRVSKLTGNFGVKFFPGFESFRFAMSIRNFSTQAKYEEVGAQLPLTFAVGVGMDILDVIRPDHSDGTSFLISSEFLHPNNYTERVNIGGEYTLIGGLIALRGGYQFNRDVQGLSGGFGLAPELGGTEARIDYSYTDMAVFSGVNRFSLGISF
jgi:hypothetical protein